MRLSPALFLFLGGILNLTILQPMMVEGVEEVPSKKVRHLRKREEAEEHHQARRRLEDKKGGATCKRNGTPAQKAACTQNGSSQQPQNTIVHSSDSIDVDNIPANLNIGPVQQQQGNGYSNYNRYPNRNRNGNDEIQIVGYDENPYGNANSYYGNSNYGNNRYRNNQNGGDIYIPPYNPVPKKPWAYGGNPQANTQRDQDAQNKRITNGVGADLQAKYKAMMEARKKKELLDARKKNAQKGLNDLRASYNKKPKPLKDMGVNNNEDFDTRYNNGGRYNPDGTRMSGDPKLRTQNNSLRKKKKKIKPRDDPNDPEWDVKLPDDISDPTKLTSEQMRVYFKRMKIRQNDPTDPEWDVDVPDDMPYELMTGDQKRVYMKRFEIERKKQNVLEPQQKFKMELKNAAAAKDVRIANQMIAERAYQKKLRTKAYFDAIKQDKIPMEVQKIAATTMLPTIKKQISNKLLKNLDEGLIDLDNYNYKKRIQGTNSEDSVDSMYDHSDTRQVVRDPYAQQKNALMNGRISDSSDTQNQPDFDFGDTLDLDDPLNKPVGQQTGGISNYFAEQEAKKKAAEEKRKKEEAERDAAIRAMLDSDSSDEDTEDSGSSSSSSSSNNNGGAVITTGYDANAGKSLDSLDLVNADMGSFTDSSGSGP